MKSPKVFISHGTADTDWAKSFAGELERRGVSVCFDEHEAERDEDWLDALEAGFRGSDVLVALLDADSASRPTTSFELGAAIGMGKPVVSILAPGVDPTALPIRGRSRRYLIRNTPELTAEQVSNALQAA